ncbi:MAG: hypothetical protein KAJ03_06785 [Gammaproteobacteria bacterium]|nr:hypothetical protein [Gammaproteobacteria bacterium]
MTAEHVFKDNAAIADMDFVRSVEFDTGLITYKNNGVLVDLTGFTAQMEVTEMSDPTVVLATWTEASEITLGGAAGTVRVTIPVATIAALAWTSARYRLTVTNPTPNPDDIQPLLKGHISVID